MSTTWTPSSWRARPAGQQPEWPDEGGLDDVLKRLAALPPLVFAGEARRLTAALGDVAQGRAFLLQAGDCAESFDGFSADSIRDKLKVILQMAIVLTYGSGVPVVKLGRIAGQFAKPRSSPTETVDDRVLPAFRGYIVNDTASTEEARIADPERLIQAYNQSAATLNLLRAFTKGGYADLNQVHAWNQEFVASSPQGRRYERLADEIERALRFMAACGIDLIAERRLHEVDFYTSHEGPLLDHQGGRSQDAALRLDDGGDRGLLRSVLGVGRAPGRRAPRVHGRGRHRMPRRRRRRARGAPLVALRDALRSAPERPPVARPRLPA